MAGTRRDVRTKVRATRISVERELLYPEVPDFANVERVLGAAVDSRFTVRIPSAACPPGRTFRIIVRPGASCRFHRRYRDRSADSNSTRTGPGSRLRHTDRLRVADALDFGLERAVVVEHLDPRVARIGRVDVALRIDGDAVDTGELAGRGASLPHDLTNTPSFENFATRALPRPSATKMLPCASHATSVGRLKTSCGAPAPAVRRDRRPRRRHRRTAARIRNRFRLPSEQKRDVALRIELHHHGGIFVDDPEVVLRIDADLRGEQKAVDALADLRVNLPVRSNWNSRDPPCTNGRADASDIVGWLVRV